MKRVVVILAALAIIGSLVAVPRSQSAQIAARTYPSYKPAAPTAVVATVPPRDPREVAMHAQLRAHPDRVDLAVVLARIDIQRSRSLSDPRYLGRAQALLSPWWTLADPPPDVRLMRATIRQSLHDFIGARADLDTLVAQRPDDGQAFLTRAVVSTVMGDYAAARDSCAQIAKLADALIATTCIAPIDGITGHLAEAYVKLSAAIGTSTDDPSIRAWSITALAELSVMKGDLDSAAAQFQSVLAIDGEDAYARAGLADVLMLQGHPAEASALVAGREVIDNLLVRRAIAEHAANGPEADKWKRTMRDRIAAAAERGDRLHMREEAMFVLAVEGDPKRALAIALEDWGVQKEMADARLVANCAVAAGDPSAAEPVRAWIRANHVVDAQLQKVLP